MANDREFIIQPLITEGKVVTLADIDPTTTYAQIGVWQDNQRQAGSSGNAYPSYVIPLSELTGGGPPPIITHNQNYLLVDARFGSDITGVPYNDLLPFQSIDAAINKASPNDVIIINPGTYSSSVNLLPFSLTYYCRPGVRWFINTFNNSFADRTINILGHGDLTFTGIVNITGAHNTNITVECLKINLGFYWFLDNGVWGASATQPLTLKIGGPNGSRTIASALGAIGLLYSLPWQLQLDFDTYTSNIFFAGADFWSIQDFQNAAAPAVKTKTVININRATLTRNGVPFLSMVAGRNANETYVNANINMINGSAGGAPFVIRFDGGGDPLACRQNVFFDGVFNIINGSMFYDQAGLSGGEQGHLQIKGKVYHQDDTATVLYTPIYAAGGTIVEIRADIISSTANNHIIQIGGTKSELDIRNAKIINTDGTGTAPANILKSGAALNVLRLDDAKLLTSGVDTILGSAPGEPVQVYSAYANIGTTNITNTLIGTAIIVDPAITDNNF